MSNDDKHANLVYKQLFRGVDLFDFMKLISGILPPQFKFKLRFKPLDKVGQSVAEQIMSTFVTAFTETVLVSLSWLPYSLLDKESVALAHYSLCVLLYPI